MEAAGKLLYESTNRSPLGCCLVLRCTYIYTRFAAQKQCILETLLNIHTWKCMEKKNLLTRSNLSLSWVSLLVIRTEETCRGNANLILLKEVFCNLHELSRCINRLTRVSSMLSDVFGVGTFLEYLGEEKYFIANHHCFNNKKDRVFYFFESGFRMLNDSKKLIKFP